MGSKKTKVLLIGDFVLNQFYHGSPSGIAKDAPVPIISIKKNEMVLGATGLVTEIISKLGINVYPVGIVGKDPAGIWLIKRFTELKIPQKGIVISSNRDTPIVSRVIADSTQIARFDQLMEKEPDVNDIKKILGLIKNRLEDVGLVVISDYGYGSISKKISKEIITDANKKNIKILVSSIGERYMNYTDSDAMIKINTDDALLLIKEPRNSRLAPQKILERLEKILNTSKILLTRSSDGIAIYENGVITEMPATRNERIDIKGIGEVMIAAISMGLVSGHGFVNACDLGNVAAGLAVSKRNIGSISRKEIMQTKKEYYDWLGQK